jgi:hypothetical protein
MAPPNKRQRYLKAHAAAQQAGIEKGEKALKLWEKRLKVIHGLTDGFSNQKGRTMTFEENKLLVLAIRYALETYLQKAEWGYNILDLNWTIIDLEVAKAFKVEERHIIALRKEFFGSGDILVCANGSQQASTAVACTVAVPPLVDTTKVLIGHKSCG